MKITNFLNDTYSEAALYMNFRNTASYVDGLKNAARKVVYTIKKKNIKELQKVSALGSEVVKTAEYLHGDSGIQGTIDTMAKSYCGANNLPVLKGTGAFGTRFTPTAAAARYIFAEPAEYFNELFKPEDDINLGNQTFEGHEIEPIYYAPTLPLLLVNGSEGIGVGFSSDIFPRSIENMFKATRAKIAKKNLKNEWFVPSWKGFKGTVELVEGSWIVKGLATFNGKKVLIEEVPMTWDLQGYTKLLRKLKEDGKISRFNDYAEDDNFKFEVYLTDEELAKGQDIILKDLGLVKSMTETLTCIDENNAIREYNNVREIFEDYYKLKIETLKKRIKSEIARLSKEEKDLNETYKFIMEVIKGTVDMKLKKAEVEKVLKEKKYTIIDKLISLPLYNLTEDKAAELKKKWKDKVAELEQMKLETPESLWTKDLDALETKLKKLEIV